jgi:hypothetical protein
LKLVLHNVVEDQESAHETMLLAHVMAMKTALKISHIEPISIQVLPLDGIAIEIVVPSVYYRYTDLNGGGLQAYSTIVSDIKHKLEEVCGIEADSQELYLEPTAHGNADTSHGILQLSDEQTISECCLHDGDTLYLSVNLAQSYWSRHAYVVKRYQAPLLHGCKTLKQALQGTRPHPASRQQIRRFMVACREVATFLGERPATHKPRTTQVLIQVEAQIQRLFSILEQQLDIPTKKGRLIANFP